jgi:hypothetical protein
MAQVGTCGACEVTHVRVATATAECAVKFASIVPSCSWPMAPACLWRGVEYGRPEEEDDARPREALVKGET